MASVATLEVISPGLLTTVQDGGRWGYGKFGVPPSGALDPFSLRVGNLLVGNQEGEAALEITLMGPEFLALEDVVIALTGADLQPLLNGDPLRMWTAHRIKKGDVIAFKGLRGGCRAYLAIGGGIDLPSIMGSKSTNLLARFGGIDGRPLKRGDVIHSRSPHLYLKMAGRSFPRGHIPSYPGEALLRVIFGPQGDEFPQEARERLLTSPYKVSAHSDRTGIRLKGPPLHRKEGVAESIISEGVVPGAIQVPGDAHPIILLRETVTGGYRKIATVITADLPLAGQLKPGDTVRFQEASLEEAHRALREMEAMIRGVDIGGRIR